MRILLCVLSGTFCLIVFLSFTSPAPVSIKSTPAIEFFKESSAAFAHASQELELAISFISAGDPKSIENARVALKVCRLKYKRIEYFIEYFFKTTAIIYNGPPKYEVEEPYMEYQTPIGLQVVESLLFEEDVYARKGELKDQAEVISSTAQDINALLYGFTADDEQILESIRLELIRIYTLGITGFDAPLLKTGIEESYASMDALKFTLEPYLETKTVQTDSVKHFLNSSLQFLHSGMDFDSFDRLTFLTQHALPLQKHLGLFIREKHLEKNTTGGVLDYGAEHLFSPGAINVAAFPAAQVHITPAAVQLGKMLFNEKALSGNKTISCATCHNPDKHFTDALPKSIAFDGHSSVKRNAPSLLYAAFQYEQFWDGRAKSLEEQVNNVLSNPDEMNGNAAVSITRLEKMDKYPMLFSNAFPQRQDSLITIDKISAAIAAFIRTLNPRNSAFDRYMLGEQSAISAGQMRGFNLFMGKAQCGTCHFAPLFNGLVPPFYGLSELEIVGTTKTDDLSRPEEDDDMGRFNLFPIEFYEKAFKTPTVRNVSATAPYMHNGSFHTLDKVVEFYNKGGGKGLGLAVKNQTLSPLTLHLTETEKSDIISFMNSLEDKISF
jgi:cytochrome c peroxidase